MGTNTFPRLAGQHPEYLITQLRHFKSGQRANDGDKQMRNVSRQLSEHEMQILAQYLAAFGPNEQTHQID
jgi:cytochrome c553